ncbi:Gfo/Idh/MocA family oxidoreductase [Paludibacter sp.]|uniref:Gfo/Idh/MocA family oxidoreductase n=1 Tax=Paludibacter sp. TaxID=1898105 RepID=UPI001352F5AD|nr:Gfo/Idh/MocA family oxidoreductase [Paludibacter sp.]MTK53065.1 oxidoreductase [Paludibacter sp.]
MKIINTALLSYGMSGKVFHAPFISLHEGFHLLGAWERSKKLIQDAYPGTRSYASLDELLADDAVELVVVNTPTYTHYEYTKRALEAGKHVVVEKAFTSTVAEAEELKMLAEKQGKKLAVYQNRRWDSDFLTVKKVIESGKLGDLKEMEIHFDRYNLDLSYKMHKEEPNSGSGIVKDLGPHAIDQALYLFGMPQAVFADIRTIRPVSIVDDCFDILLYYPTLHVRVKATLIAKEPVPAYIIHGTNGSFLKSRADIQESVLLQGVKPGSTDWGTEPESEQGTLNYLSNGETIREKVQSEQGNYFEFYKGVYTALADNQPMPVTAGDGIRVMQIIEAAFKSQAEKRVIEL